MPVKQPPAKRAKVVPPASKGGDDLEDNFAFDAASVSSYDSDSDGFTDAVSSHGEEEAAAPSPRGVAVKAGTKRSRAEMSSSSSGGGAAASAPAGGRSGERTTPYISQQPLPAQAAYITAAYKATPAGRGLTELETVSMPAGLLVRATPSAYDEAATRNGSNDVSDVARVIRSAYPGWKGVFGPDAPRPKKGKGGGGDGSSGAEPRPQPQVLVLTYSANRAADMLKPLGAFGCRVAKLFARHLSLEEQKEVLSGGPPCPIAVGTPNRILKLIEDGALALHHATLPPPPAGSTAASPLLVVVDAHADFKGFTLLTHPNLRDDFFTLWNEHVLPAAGAPGGRPIKVVLY